MGGTPSASRAAALAEPAVTALITSYNYAEYVAEAVESALSQAHRGRLEVVVVDDGSTDDSLDVLAAFGTRIRLIRQENRGQLLAFRAGLAASRGDIVCLLDSDDAWLPGKVAAVAQAFEDPEVEWVSHGLVVLHGGRGEKGTRPPAGPPGRVPGDPVLFLERRVGQATSGLSFRGSLARRLVTAIDGVSTDVADMLRHDADRVLLVLAGLERAAGYQIRQPLGAYRVHDRQKFAGGARLAMLERQIEVDRLVARITALTGHEVVPTPFFRHELVRRGVAGEGGRLVLFVRGLIAASRFAFRRPLLAARQAASLAYAFSAPRLWFRARLERKAEERA